jgi:predicted RNA-binding Zn ribbon-like protein
VIDRDLVVDFLNTVDFDAGLQRAGEHTDVLDNDDAWLSWLSEHELPKPTGVSASAVRRHRSKTRTIRDDLRKVASGEDCTIRQFPLTLTVDGREPRLGGSDALEEVMGAVARLAIRGELERVKICPADDCLWAFYDESRNGSRQWCSMAVCGNRAKARAHRARQA